jgi:hypothetical protein
MELRRRSDSRQSLDTVLGAFAQCCLDPGPEWTARQVFDRFDEISGTGVFGALYDAHVRSPAFPDLADAYAQLGLEALGGKLALKAGAPLAAVRDAIMAPGSYATPPGLLGSR